jgi:hypothetical protein
MCDKKEKKLLQEGYQPKKDIGGYQPSEHEGILKKGYQPTESVVRVDVNNPPKGGSGIKKK